MRRTRPSTAPKGDAQTECPFCHKYFKKLSRHYAASVACKYRADKYQRALLNESSHAEEENGGEDVNMEGEGMQEDPDNGEEYLSPSQFPLSPSSRPSKRPRFSPETPSRVSNNAQDPQFSPGGMDDDVFGSPGLMSSQSAHGNLFSPALQSTAILQNQQPSSHDIPTPEDDENEQVPFEAEQTFQLYAKYEFPHAGKVSAENKPTIFHEMDAGVPVAYPYSPFFNEEEWSLAEFLATSRLSKGNSMEYFITFR
ncbi:hypothetical protein M422DRAFT_45289 [Sphaerobolus stellatus SS14]|nr:hypothetical protein M422DRAFT_45289 [Sphaerobolus stellatus SS14]